MQSLKRTFNKGIMQQILDSFVDLTGIRAAFYDSGTEVVLGNNKDICSFCKQIRRYPEAEAACRTSDREAFKTAAGTGKLHLYRCHMGLWEAVVPVKLQGMPPCYLMLGQVRDPGDQSQWERIVDRLAPCGLRPDDEQQLHQTFMEVQAIDDKRLLAAARMLEIIASYIINADIIHIYDTEAVEKAISILDERYREDISTKAVANSVGLSPSYLSDLFRRRKGTTITGYLETKRLQQAKRLLEATDMSIREISSECGYQDQNYFSRLFKKRTRMSPSHYRSVRQKEC